MTTLYVEPFSGLSGDMFLGALAELSGRAAELSLLPQILKVPGAKIELCKSSRCGIQCTQVKIRQLDPDSQPLRGLPEINSIINESTLPPGARELSLRIFAVLAQAEASVHGLRPDQVHFHEVGALDSLLDICGSALLLDGLKIDKVYSGAIRTGYGFVSCHHGKLPVPAPATALLLQGMPAFVGDAAGEFCTPTGAAILKALGPDFAPATMIAERSAYGAGSRECPHPNCLRLTIGKIAEEPARTAQQSASSIFCLQANLDDSSPELLGSAFQELLFAQGALDVSFAPLLMKKGRPGFKLEVLCCAEYLQGLQACILEETSTIGVRYFPLERRVLPRSYEAVETAYGKITMKVVQLPSGRKRAAPEYADCLAAAKSAGVSIQEVLQAALLAYLQ